MSVAELPDAVPGVELPMLGSIETGRAIAWRNARGIGPAEFLADVELAAASLPPARQALNLCTDRYHFLVAFCAVARRGQANLLPPSRAPEVVAEVLARYPDSYALVDHEASPVPPRLHRLPHLPLRSASVAAALAATIPRLPARQCVAIGFTSGSTGQPQPNAKTWGGFHASTRHNLAVLQPYLGGLPAQLLATVPPQHMYGMETSVLLPLLAPVVLHCGHPFYPAEVAAALAELAPPRVLVSTPVHLRALLQAGLALPPLAAIVSATAPLPVELAQAAEAATGAPVLEMFGSTETCVIAHRRTALQDSWQLYPGVVLQPRPDGTSVRAPWLAAPVLLQDLVERLPQRRFRLVGRCSDLLEIAGKRASLGDLTQRLLALPGVQDAVVFQAEAAGPGGVRRIAALVVAPARSSAELLAELRGAIDPVFLPRPLRRVPALPRNATGKLPRAALLALLQAPEAGLS